MSRNTHTVEATALVPRSFARASAIDGLAGDDWQAYGVKFGYGLEPHWLPGTVDVGLSFDGLGVEEVDFGGLELGFRSSPGRFRLGGVLTTSAGIDGDADLSAGFSWRGDF